MPGLGSWAASIRRMALLPLGASGRRSLREDAALPWREILAGASAVSSPVSIPLSSDAWLARSRSCIRTCALSTKIQTDVMLQWHGSLRDALTAQVDYLCTVNCAENGKIVKKQDIERCAGYISALLLSASVCSRDWPLKLGAPCSYPHP